jgi:hypothetical protein
VKLFVAGKVGAEDDVSDAIASLEALGHTVPFDWRNLPVWKPYSQHKLYNTTSAQQMRRGVLESDAVVLIWHPDLLGGVVEVGMAMGASKPVYVVGHPRDSLYWCLPGVHVITQLTEIPL